MSGNELVFSPSDFVAFVNQTLEYAYPTAIIEGEISSFRVSKNRWVYFDIKDDFASVRCFGTVYSLSGPLEDGLKVRIVSQPRLHPQFGFSLNFSSIEPVGEGSLKKAQDLLFKKLEAEGLFDPSRKRLLPEIPARVGLVTSDGSAAYHDFIKILNERWSGVEIIFADSQVQGVDAPAQLVQAIEKLNSYHEPLDVLVITRGGGSADDLAAFSTEQVVRAVATSRIPTLVAIGHEVDLSVAELAADVRASTPTNAAQILVPDKQEILKDLGRVTSIFKQALNTLVAEQSKECKQSAESLEAAIMHKLRYESDNLAAKSRLIELYNPQNVLQRGYALVRDQKGQLIKTAKEAKKAGFITTAFKDGSVKSQILTP